SADGGTAWYASTGGGSFDRPGGAPHTWYLKFPICSSSPGFSFPSPTPPPFTRTPFLLPRSPTTRVSFTRAMTQGRRDTFFEFNWTSHSSCRPNSRIGLSIRMLGPSFSDCRCAGMAAAGDGECVTDNVPQTPRRG